VNVQDAIRSRYSVRAYQDRPVEQDKLLAVLEAARLAPSGGNRQPWKFVVVRDAQTRGAMMAACSGQAFIGQAPVVIAAVGTMSDRVMKCQVPGDPVDVAIAIDHMTLAAVELGLGTCWVGAFDQDAVRRVLGVPDSAKVIEVLALGYPADKPRAKDRKAMEEIVCWERWS
jgi:nitroreductase